MLIHTSTLSDRHGDTSSQNEMLAAALHYAAQGWRVIPVCRPIGDGRCNNHEYCRSPGKRPLGAEWQIRATTDTNQIREWFSCPPDCGINIGIVCGRESGIFYLDIDEHKGGDDTLDELERQYGKLPNTVDAISGRGRGKLFRYPKNRLVGNSVEVNLGPGLDVRSDGGQFVCHPSLHEIGRQYSWDGAELPTGGDVAEPPSWLVDLVAKPEVAKPVVREAIPATGGAKAALLRAAERYLLRCQPAVEGSGGDNQTFNVAGHLASFVCEDMSLTVSDAIDLMGQHFNPRCSPPWSDADLATKVHSGFTNGSPRAAKLVPLHGDDAEIEQWARSVALEPKVSSAPERPDDLIVTDWGDVTGDVEWLWQDKIPLEGLTLVAGEAGLGKSTAVLSLASLVSRGGTFPDGTSAPLCDAIVFTAEDASKIVKKRLMAQGADLARIHKIEGRLVKDRTCLFEARDIGTLEAAIARFPNTRLIIIDPIASFISGVKSHENADVRSILRPLSDFAEKHRVAMVLVCHLNKDQTKGANNRITGSGAWRDAARAAWFVVKDNADDNVRLWLPNKNNYAALGEGFVFGIDGGMVNWRGATHQKLDDVLAMTTTKTDQAEEYLRQALRDGERPCADVIEGGEAQGIAKGTLYTAKDKIGVQSRKVGVSGGWLWRLNDRTSETPPREDDDNPF